MCSLPPPTILAIRGKWRTSVPSPSFLPSRWHHFAAKREVDSREISPTDSKLNVARCISDSLGDLSLRSLQPISIRPSSSLNQMYLGMYAGLELVSDVPTPHTHLLTLPSTHNDGIDLYISVLNAKEKKFPLYILNDN